MPLWNPGQTDISPPATSPPIGGILSQGASMREKNKFRRVCRDCRSVSDREATKCANCGADLDAGPEQFAEDDPRLLHVDPQNRHEVERFVRLDEAELACGMLRANG